MSKKFIVVQMDKERKLRLTNSAIYEIEEKFKRPMAKMDAENLYHKDIITILCAALKWEDKELTCDEAMELFDEYLDIGDTYKLFGELMANTFGSPNGQGIVAEVVTAQVTEVGTGTQPSELLSNAE
jgi:hypothetical protein